MRMERFYIQVPIKSIHRKRLPVSKLHGGQTASFSLRKFKKKDLRKGTRMNYLFI